MEKFKWIASIEVELKMDKAMLDWMMEMTNCLEI